ncbi:mannosyl-oligosaccharide alpha-1,2-mannosidase-like protein [Lindgomyces ingoldianus]|uniref:Mannosyl-oligosaccharide alpha-1,2-mannosidase-like protein n=1 Tax=Lindgomyces ingoldianus TaxID=673940 RepID=A0ACB6RCZ1_9PLEO|nr:mannosyl-oligosaccharide alpha-1,2-mannosidase-like protein [Lindgomyces ingoldianus]KAF2477011.1 mannosyl-oligosaccharide alpha-1,2-mannosidase-like protein [Lindgomyces ingoldianus]
MTRIKSVVLGTAILPAVLALPKTTPTHAHYRGRGYDANSTSDRAQAVVDVFRTAWGGYYKYAFPHDELHPVSNSFSDSRNAWGASAVDALSTALVMGQKDIVNQILDYIPTIDYTKTATEVSLFETTIRYLGGMLSGYDFLTGPLSDLADNKNNVDALLKQSETLANALSYAFETPTGIPWNNLFFTSRSNDGSANGLATVGTLVLEWTRLSDLSGNTSYGALTQKAESYLLNPSPPSSEPWTGLVGTDINVTTGQFLDSTGGWVGGDDSFYEYLIKMFIYDPSRFATYRDRWILAADSTISHLTSHPSSRPDLTFVAMYNGRNPSLISQHLACFDGGNFILGGQVLGVQKYINYGLQLVDGCHETYIATATGIGPEVFGWDSKRVPADQAEFFNKSGFYIQNPTYDLRPEVLESFYYAYRATGDPKYQDWAWEGFLAINATTRVGSGYSNIDNVNVAGGGGYGDFQESFWFAEVLKYAYLIQAAEAEWQVSKDGKNAWVFNTEAHPFKVAS